MVRQLSALDAQFLHLESDRAPLHVGLLAVLDPPEAPGGHVRVEVLRAALASRLHLAAPLRWRLREVPFGLDLPSWQDAGAPVLEDHVRETHVPGPGTAQQLADVVAELAARRLDRRRPLWECHLISGLADGRQALYAKVHHALVDGVSGAEVLGALFDVTRSSSHWQPPRVLPAERATHRLRLLARAAPNQVGRTARFAGAAGSLVPALRSVGPIAGGRSPLNGRLTARRSVSFGSVPLEDVKAVKNAFGATVNDVVVALCAAALRRWLCDQGTAPRRPLVAAVPVSTRTPEQVGTAGNRIAVMLAELPVDTDDPVTRLRAAGNSMAEAKRRLAAAPTGLLDTLATGLPPVAHGLATRLLCNGLARARPPVNLLISNVPGPQFPLFVAGARVEHTFPVSVISDLTGALNITVMSYDGRLDIGVATCPDAVPATAGLLGSIEQDLDDLLAAARSSTPRAPARRVG